MRFRKKQQGQTPSETMATNDEEKLSTLPPPYSENKKSIIDVEESRKKVEEDAWAIVMNDDDDYEKFSDLSGKQKALHVLKVFLKITGVLLTLYLFICSLGLMSSAFQILAGETGGQLLNNEYLSNPITGLIIGIMVTVLVQSSSTSTSIIVTMVGAGIIEVHDAIPIIMGANIGTSVTNTIVALTQSMDRNQFRKSFAGATVHDMFNFLSVLILLPLETITGVLEKITDAILEGSNLQQGNGGPELLSAIIDPVTDHVIQVNRTIIALVAQQIPMEENASMVKVWCERQEGNMSRTYEANSTACNSSMPCTVIESVMVGVRKCDVNDFIFANTGMSDPAVGSILLVISLFTLCACLIFMVKLLSSMLRGSVARIIKKVLNTNFPYPFGWISGYLAIIVGAIITFLVQSSSVFTSTMTPLVGMGIISLKRMYPLTIGANIGTTATGMLAALATDSNTGLVVAVQIALCHFFFNIFGIVIWYPIPLMRRVPIRAAKTMGNTTAKYRWFAVVYLIFGFFLIPGVLLGLSFAGIWVLGGFLILCAVIIITVIIINVLQSRKPQWLPESMRTWDFLPKPLHSLQPYDKIFRKILLCCKCCIEEEEESSRDDSISYITTSIEMNDDIKFPNGYEDAEPILEKKELVVVGQENLAFGNDGSISTAL